MKKNTIKHTIIAGFISISGVVLFLGGYIFTDVSNRANSLVSEPKKATVTLVKNVPTSKELTKLSTTTMKKQTAEKKEAASITKDTTAPMITVSDEIVELNAQVNIYDAVTAIDDNDGDITAKLSANKDLDTSILGPQTIHYTATDTHGNIGSADKTFTIVEKSEPVVAQMTEPVPEETSAVPVEPATPEPVSAPVPQTEPAYGPMTMTMNGQTIPYQNGGQGAGQSIIDSNPGGVASTWGGAAVQSGDDGQNTHFIGHNPGVFSTVFSLGIGSQIVVTDANGTPTTYTVRTLLQLDDYGTEVGTGTNYWDLTVGTGGGERISLQSCVNDDINLFAIAYK